MRRLLLVLMCLCLVSPLLAENLLVNPAGTGTVEGWGARFGPVVEVITTNPHSGNYCYPWLQQNRSWHASGSRRICRRNGVRNILHGLIWVRTSLASRSMLR
jgi:hypothetical protein